MAADTIVCTPEEVLSFWFEECTSEDWFRSTIALDEEMRRRFRDTHLALAAGVPDSWRTTPERRLAAVMSSISSPATFIAAHRWPLPRMVWHCRKRKRLWRSAPIKECRPNGGYSSTCRSNMPNTLPNRTEPLRFSVRSALKSRSTMRFAITPSLPPTAASRIAMSFWGGRRQRPRKTILPSRKQDSEGIKV